ncbi:hypothetical protein P350_36940 [Burkholderia cepacia JBK9]|nr:hypothetical protein P350_36940 [Burkholderia cepacia JBK9]
MFVGIAIRDVRCASTMAPASSRIANTASTWRDTRHLFAEPARRPSLCKRVWPRRRSKRTTLAT